MWGRVWQQLILVLLLHHTVLQVLQVQIDISQVAEAVEFTLLIITNLVVMVAEDEDKQTMQVHPDKTQLVTQVVVEVVQTDKVKLPALVVQVL